MEHTLQNIHNFLDQQVKTYPQENYIQIYLGKKIEEGIFKTIYKNNNECEFAKLIKHFRNFKLSYSQGKIYQNLDTVLKTFNNKYNEVHRYLQMDRRIISHTKYDLCLENYQKEVLEEFPLQKNYNSEEEYDEVNIHISGDSHDQLLIFQKKGDYYLIKLELKLDINLPYKHLELLVKDIEKVLVILEEEGLDFTLNKDII